MGVKSEKESGQILLIIILVSTVLLTIGLSVSHITSQEQRVAKLEEEKKKAFAAAEAGLDAALSLQPGGSFNITSLGLPDIQSGTANVLNTPSPIFNTTQINKDEQFTLYMANYVSGVPLPTPAPGDYFNGDITLYMGSSGLNCTSSPPLGALELTLISSANVATRWLVDPCDRIEGTDDWLTTEDTYTLGAVNYTRKTSSARAVSSTKVILIRLLSTNAGSYTRVGIDAGSTNLPLQGKTVLSSAETKTGVVQKVELFQSYPQIPTNFYVTSF